MTTKLYIIHIDTYQGKYMKNNHFLIQLFWGVAPTTEAEDRFLPRRGFEAVLWMNRSDVSIHGSLSSPRTILCLFFF